MRDFPAPMTYAPGTRIGPRGAAERRRDAVQRHGGREPAVAFGSRELLRVAPLPAANRPSERAIRNED